MDVLANKMQSHVPVGLLGNCFTVEPTCNPLLRDPGQSGSGSSSILDQEDGDRPGRTEQIPGKIRELPEQLWRGHLSTWTVFTCERNQCLACFGHAHSGPFLIRSSKESSRYSSSASHLLFRLNSSCKATY